MNGTEARPIRWFVLVIFILGMVACRPRSTAAPGSPTPGGEPAVTTPTESVQPTPITASAGEATAAPAPTQTATAATAPEAAPETPEPSPTTAAESAEPVSVSAVSVNTAFILDASGSMLNGLDGRTRLAVAQDATAKLSAGLPAGMKASLWVYGHRVEKTDKSASCRDIEEVIALGPVDAARFSTMAHSYAAKGYTPITEALRRAATSLPTGERERNTIVLVSDGEETCGGDPCALAAALAAGDTKVVIHAVGLDVNETTRAQLKCIADVTGGTYRDAGSAEELDLALEEAAEAAAEEAAPSMSGLGRPSSVAISPNGEYAYVTSPGVDTLLVLKRDSTTGTLTFVEVHKNRADGVDGLRGAYSAAVSPDGKNVYVASTHDQMGVFSRDTSTGKLTFVEAHKDGVAGVDGLYGALSVAVSPDSGTVYVAGSEDDAVAVFDRDTATGALTFVQVLKDGVDGVDGLDRVQAVTVSPDSEHVYTASNPGLKDDALVHFKRDRSTGKLTFVKAYVDGVDELDGLQGASSVAVSLDNRHVYVASRTDDAVAIFGRDPDTKALTFVAAHKGDVRGKARALAISPDGKNVYVVTDIGDTILVFGRDGGTGTLTFIEVHKDNEDGVDGLEYANSVTVSPDNKNVYVTGLDDRAVAVFSRDTSTGRLTFVEVVRNATSGG